MFIKFLEHLAHVLITILLGGAQLVLDGLAQLICLCVQLLADTIHVVQLPRQYWTVLIKVVQSKV